MLNKKIISDSIEYLENKKQKKLKLNNQVVEYFGWNLNSSNLFNYFSFCYIEVTIDTLDFIFETRYRITKQLYENDRQRYEDIVGGCCYENIGDYENIGNGSFCMGFLWTWETKLHCAKLIKRYLLGNIKIRLFGMGEQVHSWGGVSSKHKGINNYIKNLEKYPESYKCYDVIN